MFGPALPVADFQRFTICNRFAASAEGRSMIVGPPPDRYAGPLRFPDAFYSIKDRIIHHFGRQVGLALQHWTSDAYDYSYNEEMEGGCDHYHILERTRLRGRTYHKPTGHFSWSNCLSEDYKETVGFDEMKARCVERIEGKKRVTRAVPDRSEAFHALKKLWKRYARLHEPAREPKPRVHVGNYFNERMSRAYAEERAKRAATRVRCNGCMLTFGGLEVEKVEGYDYCAECRAKIFQRLGALEEIPF
jgi:hypothetical protein